MGDEKSSHFLKHMKSMVDRNVPDSVLKTFLEQLPQSLYDVLAVNPGTDLTTLALLADRVMEFRPTYIASMNRSNMATSSWQSRAKNDHIENNMLIPYQSKDDNATIQHQLAEITRRMAAMESNISKRRSFRRRFRSQSRGRRPPSRHRSPSTGRSGGLYYYHYNFGARAYQCNSPCTWSSVTATNGNIAVDAQQAEN